MINRLDIWHFMRRLSTGCTTDCHPLYASFMRGLSRAIFKIEESDLKLLKEAKRSELTQLHLNPSDSDVLRQISSDAINLHCRRMTRNVGEICQLIDSLISALDGDNGKDQMGVPLFDSEKMYEVWSIQRRHVPCIIDPIGIPPYTQTGTSKKGDVVLPIYRCARGSTSLESFHLHMNRFIPGNSQYFVSCKSGIFITSVNFVITLFCLIRIHYLEMI